VGDAFLNHLYPRSDHSVESLAVNGPATAAKQTETPLRQLSACEDAAPVKIERTITIARTPDEVWDFIADMRNDPRWCPKVVSVEQLAGEGAGPGTKYRVMHQPRPRRPPVELSVDVVEFERPRRMRVREEDRDGVFNVLYLLEPADTGTRLSQIDEIDWKVSPLLYPIARAMVSRDLARQFATLKRTLEAT
jgi:uncharacterized protein YndB with AHSA1/START domain